MLNPNRTIHHTAVTQITGAAGEGWEIYCNDCDYRMRYYSAGCAQETHLEVISLGDVNFRHLSESSLPLVGIDEFIDERWLTPEIRHTIEAIVKRLDD